MMFPRFIANDKNFCCFAVPKLCDSGQVPFQALCRNCRLKPGMKSSFSNLNYKDFLVEFGPSFPSYREVF
ncbi:hypothetical protein L596_025095 [Steinernema carpocapsae]|uniref:Uncharacterized protein n=1 Tax=Steinernema carpocapsae TaxID=34508 RepID=A0A4U5M6S9_STECR|nr:hypothetical protein L596_025095 [Steinernema carpocapsae]